MSLLNDILEWTESSLKLWQRDAVRRLFQKESVLTAQDYDELYLLLKLNHGIPHQQNLQAIPLAAEHLPVQISDSTAIILKSMKNLVHVNRIAPSQTLTFSPKGITVVYGGNGSGKSGYTRVLKRACRARDQSEPVHPDATEPNIINRKPEATFDIEINGTLKSVKWTCDIIPPDELSMIAVFDSHCARAYLSEGEAAYQPYGLDIVENLAYKVYPELTTRLTQEIATINVDVEPFKYLQGNTVVGKMIVSLSESTDPEFVSKLAAITQDENNHRVELDKILAEVDPKAKAKQVMLSVKRFEGLAERIDFAFSSTGDTQISKLRELDEATQQAANAEKVAAEQFRAGEALLPGTGELVWKKLFDSARKFSIEAAYQNHEFPHVDNNAQCPLCQQSLGADAIERMKRFERFIQEDVAKVAFEKRGLLNNLIKSITLINISFSLDDALAEELTSLERTLVDSIRLFESGIATRRSWMLNAVKTHTWGKIPAIGEDPRQRLRELIANLKDSATKLDSIEDKKKREVLESERQELRARHQLGDCTKAIIALIERKRLKEKLEVCRSDLKTRAISEKSQEFASKAVTTVLNNALNSEFQELGMGHIKTKLKERPEKGKMQYKIILDLPVNKKIEEILSEGEQRAIAIGAFFAELSLANHSGGIIFDDPVSSLDHWRRRQVARRLVNEAKLRQVVVFTHDTTFLGELREATKYAQVDNKMCNLECDNGHPGHIREGLPWEHQSYKERIDALEQAQKMLEKKPWPVYPNENESMEMRNQYSHFRATIERVIQDVVFSGVVTRYRDWIRVDRLNKVVGFSIAEHDEIARLHKRCCDVVDAHDPSSAKTRQFQAHQSLERIY